MERKEVIEALSEMRREAFLELNRMQKTKGTTTEERNKCFRNYKALHLAIMLLKEGKSNAWQNKIKN